MRRESNPGKLAGEQQGDRAVAAIVVLHLGQLPSGDDPAAPAAVQGGTPPEASDAVGDHVPGQHPQVTHEEREPQGHVTVGHHVAADDDGHLLGDGNPEPRDGQGDEYGQVSEPHHQVEKILQRRK